MSNGDVVCVKSYRESHRYFLCVGNNSQMPRRYLVVSAKDTSKYSLLLFLLEVKASFKETLGSGRMKIRINYLLKTPIFVYL